MKRRVVITSLGVVSSLGKSLAEIRTSLQEDRVAFERPVFDPEVVVSPVKDFDLRHYTGAFKEKRYLNRGAALALATALEAVRGSGLTHDVLLQAGLFVGAGPHLDIGTEFPAIAGGRIDRSNLDAL